MNKIQKLSDSIKHKFINIINLKNWQIESDQGWSNIKSINKTIKYQVYKIKTEKNKKLDCADNHILIDEFGNEIFAKDSLNKNIKTKDGFEKVISVSKTNKFENMYDFELAEESNHLYYTNKILSHNTTSYTIFCLWLATLNAEKKIMICANKLQTSIEIMDRIRMAYEYLPKFIKPGILVYNKQEITFSNKSTIRAFATSSSASRGFSGNVVIIDEMAFVPSNILDEFFASVMPVISSSKNSKAIIVSTPNGSKGLFYNIWTRSNSKDITQNKEGWKPFRIRWFETGGIRDENWKKQQIATIGLEKWKQEFECDFLTSTTKRLIPEDIIDKYRMKFSEYKLQGIIPGKKLIIMSPNEEKSYEFTMFFPFNETRTYAASADTAEGGGGDADESVLYIWDVTDLSEIIMCAEFSSNNISIIEFSYVVYQICKLYACPYFIAERNGISKGMIDTLSTSYKYDKIVTDEKKGKLGIFSHVQNKGKACLWCKEMLLTKGFSFKIFDEQLIDDFYNFVKKDTKGIHPVYSAIVPTHDDHILSFIWLCFLLNNEFVEKYFIVADTFKTELGQIYAKNLVPLEEYTEQEIYEIKNNKLYKEFMLYQENLYKKNNIDFYKLKISKSNSNFKINKEKQQIKIDPFFGDFENINEKTWNNQNNSFFNSKINLNTNVVIPSFFINSSSGFSDLDF